MYIYAHTLKIQCQQMIIRDKRLKIQEKQSFYIPVQSSNLGNV